MLSVVKTIHLGPAILFLRVQEDLLSTTGACFPFIGEADARATWSPFLQQVQGKNCGPVKL